jgi:hypothetical protein
MCDEFPPLVAAVVWITTPMQKMPTFARMVYLREILSHRRPEYNAPNQAPSSRIAIADLSQSLRQAWESLHRTGQPAFLRLIGNSVAHLVETMSAVVRSTTGREPVHAVRTNTSSLWCTSVCHIILNMAIQRLTDARENTLFHRRSNVSFADKSLVSNVPDSPDYNHTKGFCTISPSCGVKTYNQEWTYPPKQANMAIPNTFRF